MPVFYLNVVDGELGVRDPEGADLLDVAAAVDLAIASAREIMADRLRAGKPLGLKQRFDIEDENGSPVASVTFADALPPETQ